MRFNWPPTDLLLNFSYKQQQESHELYTNYQYNSTDLDSTVQKLIREPVADKKQHKTDTSAIKPEIMHFHVSHVSIHNYELVAYCI